MTSLSYADAAPIRPLTNGQLALVTIARLAMMVAFRIVYPLQPFLASNLHVDLTTISALVTVQLLASLVSPLGGTLADLRGERTVMCAGLGLFCLGALLCAISGSFTGFLVGYGLIGLSVSCYQPASTAYLSARTTYARRGWVLGVFETSWAGAALLGVAPLMVIVQLSGMVQPVYWTLFVAGLLSLGLIYFALPPTPIHAHSSGKRIDWAAVRNRSVIALLALMSMVMFAYDFYGVVQSAWLKQAFGVSEAQLGQTAAIAGAAELCGSVGVALLVDRLGKKRTAIGGFLIAALCLALLPLSTISWVLFLGLQFCFFLAEEFAIVAALPLISGVAPTARGTVLSLNITITSMVRALGAGLSVGVWERSGIWTNALVAAALTAAAALICGLFVREVEGERAVQG